VYYVCVQTSINCLTGMEQICLLTSASEAVNFIVLALFCFRFWFIAHILPVPGYYWRAGTVFGRYACESVRLCVCHFVRLSVLQMVRFMSSEDQTVLQRPLCYSIPSLLLKGQRSRSTTRNSQKCRNRFPAITQPDIMIFAAEASERA